MFIETFGEACEKTVLVHAWVLMSNNDHFVFRTPQATSCRGCACRRIRTLAASMFAMHPAMKVVLGFGAVSRVFPKEGGSGGDSAHKPR
jgi:hypothetical protein